MEKRYLGLAAIVIIGVGALGLRSVDRLATTGAAYKAKIVCSEVFVGGRSPDDVIAQDFSGISPFLDKVHTTVDAENRTVTAALHGLGKSRAVHRNGYGCTIVRGGALAALPPLPAVNDQPWPERDDPSLRRSVERIIAAAIADTDAGHRGIAVFMDGEIIAEGYADGFSADSRFLSWSMAKSVTATIMGAAIHKNLMTLAERPALPAWSGENDPRGDISWTDLLHMQSGLDFAEDYSSPTSDVNLMLWQSRSMAAKAARATLAHTPGDHWSYSSGTTNIIQHGLRNALESRNIDYHRFAHETLFAPLGMTSAVFEPDAAGDFVGSSFMYATARDWAKLGQLYLNNGAWDGTQILPEDWPDFARAPSSASDGQYGAQFWLNLEGTPDDAGEKRAKWAPGLPQDAYFMAGHEGQYVVIVPDVDAVIVRFGRTTGVEPIVVNAPVFGEIYQTLASR